MNYRGNQKDIANKVEDYFVHLWLPAVLSLLLLFLFWNKFALNETLVIDQSVEKGGQLQVFFDTGNGFSQEQSRSFLFNDQTGLRQRIEIEIGEFKNLTSIRIDPIDNDGPVLLQALRVKRKGFWTSDDLLKPEYENPNRVRFQWNAKKSVLHLYPDAGTNDPFFILPYEFEVSSLWEMTTKFGLFALGALLVSVGLCFIASGYLIWLLSLCLYWLGLVVVFIRFLTEKYTLWINRLSRKWGVVNPTSCISAAVILSFIITLAAFDGSFWQQIENSKRELYFEFEVVGGNTESVRLFFSKDKGFRYADSVGAEVLPGVLPQKVRVGFQTTKGHMARIRLDPRNGEGEVVLKNIQLRSGYRLITKLDMRGWQPNRELEILDENETTWHIRSIGQDPFAVSPEFDISLTPPFALPIRVGFFLVLMFFISTALLIYNRLITEGMSHQDILNLQRG